MGRMDLLVAASARQIPGVRVFHGVEKNFSMVWKTFGEKGRGGLNFSTVWKTFFHGVEKRG
jgi:hypothetical protein